ncbi:MAG: signal peptidase I [Clostridiales bacterium GWB2_37_7]|nr:MAG: signal peptidase I [Clostridiales bacterium GWB2_37_7]
MKKIGNWLSNVLLIIVILIAVSYIFNLYQVRKNPETMPGTFGFIPLTVLSGSMSPAIETGDMIVISSVKENLKVGDIITYDAGDFLITHRIIEAAEENNQVMYITQGDANNTRDTKLVSQDQVLGKYQFRIPYAGYVMTYLRGWLGIVTVMGLLMIYLITVVIKETKTQLNKAKGSNQ